MGRLIAQRGDTLVFGGCSLGLMNSIAGEVKAFGGVTVGIVPQKVEQRNAVFEGLDVKIPCSDLTDRKALFMAKSDVFVALPGGIGTLDEVFTVMAQKTIGYMDKPLVLLNIDHFFDTLLLVLDEMQASGFIRGDYHKHVSTASSVEELAGTLQTLS